MHGCGSFVPSVMGDLATEDVHHLPGDWIQSRIEIDAALELAQWLGDAMSEEAPSKLPRVGDLPKIGIE